MDALAIATGGKITTPTSKITVVEKLEGSLEEKDALEGTLNES